MLRLRYHSEEKQNKNQRFEKVKITPVPTIYL